MDWVGPLSTAIVGIAGLIATIIANGRGIRSQERLARQSAKDARSAEIRLARRAAYVALLHEVTTLENLCAHLIVARSLIENQPSEPSPESLDEAVRRTRANMDVEGNDGLTDEQLRHIVGDREVRRVITRGLGLQRYALLTPEPEQARADELRFLRLATEASLLAGPDGRDAIDAIRDTAMRLYPPLLSPDPIMDLDEVAAHIRARLRLERALGDELQEAEGG